NFVCSSSLVVALTRAMRSSPAVSSAAAAPTATTAATATATEAAASAAAAVLALFRFVHAKRAAVDHGAVHLLDGLLCFLRRGHRHEAEATRTTGVAIGDDVNVRHLAELGERRTKRLDGGIEGEVADVEPVTHDCLTRLRPRETSKSCHPISRHRRRSR